MRKLLFIIPVLASQLLFAQGPSLPKVIQPSPTAASLGKYGDIPVGYHTGTVNVSVPIYEVKEGPISLPISLNYHSAGIRVSEAASWVGLGWALNAGGVISRSSQHVPDEGPLKPTPPQSSLANSTYYTTSGYYKDGYILPPHLTFGSFTVENGWANPADAQIYSLYHNAAAGNIDAEPDIFFYNFGNYSGKFQFKVTKVGSTLQREVIFIPKADVKVDVDFQQIQVPTHVAGGTTPLTTFVNFTITTPDGFKYFFGGTGAIEYSGTESYNMTSFEFSDNVRFIPTSWYLNKILAPDGHFVILEYESDTYSFFDLGAERCWGGNHFLDLTNQTIMRTAINGKKLKRILTSTEEILFEANTVREDLGDYENTGGTEEISNRTSKLLDRIHIKRITGESIKKFDLAYSYFQCTDGAFPQSIASAKAYYYTDLKRLKLLSVTEKSGDESLAKPPYLFTYNETQPLPRRISFQQDHWGYFNGAYLNKSLIAFLTKPRNANRESNFQYSQAGSLTSLTYPTGSVSTFEYEPNKTFGTVVNDVDIGQMGTNYSAGTFVFDGEPDVVTTPIEIQKGWPDENSPCYTAHLGCDEYVATVTVRAGDPRLPNEHLYDLSYWETAYQTQIIAAIYNEAGNPVYAWFIGDLGRANTTDCQSQFGCSFQVTPASPTPPNYIQIGRDVNVTLPPGNYTLKALRFKGPKVGDASKNVMYTANVSLWLPATNDPNYQVPATTKLYDVGGLRIKSITTTDRSNQQQKREFKYPSKGGILYGMPNYFFAATELSNSTWYPGSGYIFSNQLWASGSILPMSSVQGSHIGYSTVKELQQGNGYSKYTYDSLMHIYSIPSNPYANGMSVNYTSADTWLTYPVKPLPLTLERGNLIREEKFNEAGTRIYQKDSEYEVANVSLMMTSTKIDFFITPNDVQIASHVHYPIFTGTTRLLSETETTYDVNGANPTTKVRELTYGSSNHLLATESKVTTSEGQESVKTIYPPDYGTMGSTVAGIKYLNDNHIINTPIEQVNIRRDMNGNNPLVTGGTLNTYKTTAANEDEIKTLDITQPIPLSSFNLSNHFGNQFDPSPLYKSKINFYNYDSDGNIQEVGKTNDVHLAYVYGYNNSLPIAEIKNATKDQVFNNSFEDAVSNTSSDARTGLKSYSGLYTVPLPSAGTYILTYWQKTSTVDWTLITTTISSSTNIGGSGILLDDVRVYPAGAQITTYTYDLVFGMTSMSDANNRITYYEYDKLGRLAVIRDHDKNVLKTFTYNYR